MSIQSADPGDLYATHWKQLGNCAGRDPMIFYPDDDLGNRNHIYDAARAICAACVVIDVCGREGQDEDYGMWGGMSPTQRHPKPRRPKSEPTAVHLSLVGSSGR